MRLAEKPPQDAGLRTERKGEAGALPAICLGEFETGGGGEVKELGDLDMCAPSLPPPAAAAVAA